MADEEDPLNRLGKDVETELREFGPTRQLETVIRTARRFEQVERVGQGAVRIAKGSSIEAAKRVVNIMSSSVGLGRVDWERPQLPMHPRESQALIERFEKTGHLAVAAGLAGPTVSRSQLEDNAHSIRRSLFLNGWLHGVRELGVFSASGLVSDNEYSDSVRAQLYRQADAIAMGINHENRKSTGTIAHSLNPPVNISSRSPMESLLMGFGSRIKQLGKETAATESPQDLPDSGVLIIMPPPVAREIMDVSMPYGSSVVLDGELSKAIKEEIPAAAEISRPGPG